MAAFSFAFRRGKLAETPAPRVGAVPLWALMLIAAALAGGSGCSRDEAAVGGTHSTSGGAVSKVATSGANAAPATDLSTQESAPWEQAPPLASVPAWIVDAVFYQIFPERFRNGDPANDPTHDSLEFPDLTPRSWAISPWTGDWYARADWEQAAGSNFFDNGVFNRRYGGDLQGVLDKLDYLQKLGVTAIYFNPVFYARSLHKYDGASMHHVDPYFGPDPAGDFLLMADETSDPQSWRWTAADKLFLRVVDQLHRRKMHVVIDGVFNHTGRDFFAFADLRAKQEQSPYREWYIVQRFDDPRTPANEFRYKGWWNVDTLPEFADAPGGGDLHPGPKAYLMDITRRWMDPNGDGDPSDGVDGWRLDVANEAPLQFWKDWNALVRTINPASYTTAEIWDDARQFLVDGGFSATMNYHAFAFLVKGYLIDGRLSAHDFGRELALRREIYPPAMQFALQNLVDSHDTERVASMIVNRLAEAPYQQPPRFDYDVGSRVSARHDAKYVVRAPNDAERRIQRLIALMQMTYVGAPMVYYGDEAGMWGGDDPCDRMPMVWDDLQYEPQAGDPLGRPREPDAVAFDRPLHDFYQRLISLRRDHAALRRGAWAAAAEDDAAKFFAFSRRLADDDLLVALNRGDADYLWRLPSGWGPDATLLASTIDGGQLQLASDNEAATVVVPAMSGIVLSKP